MGFYCKNYFSRRFNLSFIIHNKIKEGITIIAVRINEVKNNFKKGTLIFWKGHIAICINKKSLIHAYGPRKKVIIMDIKKTINEIKNNSNLIITRIKKINAFRKKK